MRLGSRVIWLRRLRGFATSCFLRNLLGEGVEKGVEKNKRGKIINILPLRLVGMTGFEPATPRPPDVYSNRAELHPELVLRCKDNNNFPNNANLLQKKCNFVV